MGWLGDSSRTVYQKTKKVGLNKKKASNTTCLFLFKIVIFLANLESLYSTLYQIFGGARVLRYRLLFIVHVMIPLRKKKSQMHSNNKVHYIWINMPYDSIVTAALASPATSTSSGL